MHNFMDSATVARADSDEVVRARLASCVFKGAVKQGDEWVAVPMCRMNERTWTEVYARRLHDPALHGKQGDGSKSSAPEEKATAAASHFAAANSRC